MSKSTRIAHWLYQRSLRLYPHTFRTIFGDEMIDVFTNALDEAAEQGGGALLRFCLRETGALSSSVVREQIAADRAHRLVPVPEGILMQSHEQVFSYRFNVTVILILTAALCLLIVLPFFGLGLQLEPAYAVANGAYDPKGYPFFQSGPGSLVHLLGMISLAVAPVGVIAFGLRLAFLALRNWRGWSVERRRLAVITLVVGVGLIAFLFSDAGRVVTSWYVD